MSEQISRISGNRPMPSISKLIFTPVDYRQTVSDTVLADGLQSLAWLGNPFVAGPANSFFVGEAFFKYITFMGCAPAMRLEPETADDRNFCFIHLNTHLSQPRFRGHHERFVPRCPECRRGLSDWPSHLKNWEADHSAHFVCPHCGVQLSMPGLNWREKAAIGCSFIEVYSVYPHEGIPTPSFLTHLKSISGVDWKYFFEPG